MRITKPFSNSTWDAMDVMDGVALRASDPSGIPKTPALFYILGALN